MAFFEPRDPGETRRSRAHEHGEQRRRSRAHEHGEPRRRSRAHEHGEPRRRSRAHEHGEQRPAHEHGELRSEREPAYELGGERGQASVELVALLPLIAVIAAIGWQAVVAGQAVWLAGSAARAAARADAVGADARAAARRSLPERLRPGVAVRSRGEHGVRVAIEIPSVIGAGRLGTVSARAWLQDQTR